MIAVIKKIGIPLFALVLTGLPGNAVADESWYAAVHGGKTLLYGGYSGPLQEDHVHGGLIAGRKILATHDLSVFLEGDVSFPLSEGTAGEDGTWSHWFAALYGVGRLGNQAAYLKFKLGVVYQELETVLLLTSRDSDFGLSGGLGPGVNLGDRFFLEIEATFVDKNIGVLRGALGLRF